MFACGMDALVPKFISYKRSYHFIFNLLFVCS